MEGFEKLAIVAGGFAGAFIAQLVSSAYKEWKLNKKRLRAGHDLSPMLERDMLINAKLAQLLYAVGAHKSKIFRFHNGGVYYSGQPIKKFSMTHLFLRNGIAGPKPSDLKDLTASLFPNMLKQLIEGKDKVLMWDRANAPDDFLKSLHLAEGTNIVICITLRDYQGQMLGFLSLNWINETVTLTPEIEATIQSFAREIGDLLSFHRAGKA